LVERMRRRVVPAMPVRACRQGGGGGQYGAKMGRGQRGGRGGDGWEEATAGGGLVCEAMMRESQTAIQPMGEP
jgi:hypothetical protein